MIYKRNRVSATSSRAVPVGRDPKEICKRAVGRHVALNFARAVDHDRRVCSENASGHAFPVFGRDGVDEAGMLHVSVPALGGNARRFATGGERQGHGLATLTLQNGELVVEGRLAPDFQSAVATESLPETIRGSPGALRRIEGTVSLRD